MFHASLRFGGTLTAALVGILTGARAPAAEIAPGVTYTQYNLVMPDGRPNVVYVVATDRFHSEYKWKLGWAQKKRNYTAREGTSVIAGRYNNPPSHEVLAAVNAVYFDGTNLPRIVGIGQTAGEMLDIPNFNASYQYQNVMVGPTRLPFVVQNFSPSQGTITFADGFSMALNRYNWNSAGSLVPIHSVAAFTPHFDSVTPEFGSALLAAEVVVGDVSYPMRSEKEVSGVITSVITSWTENNPGHTPIPAGGMVLCAYGNTRSQVLAHAVVGQRIKVRPVTSSPEYNNADNAVTGIGWVVHNGAPYSSSWGSLDSGAAYGSRQPRTQLAWNNSTWFMIVCDGRTAASVGMTFNEIASFIIGTLGGTEAVNFDGGGSSTMVVNGTVRNVPSDGSQRAVANAMLLVRQDTSTQFPLFDPFTPAGRLPGWDDKFYYSAVGAFSPTSPGGDGSVLTVTSPVGGVNTVRRGDFGDIDYSTQADIYCEYRPDVVADGFERYALFARDSGTGALGLSSYGGGNCYAMTCDSDTGRIRAGKYVNGTLVDFLESAPVYRTDSAWHRFRIDCTGTTIAYQLDDTVIATATDATHARGYCGVGYHEFFTTNANMHGTRADNFASFVVTLQPGDMDGDEDVDQEDFGQFQACFSGFSIPQPDTACVRAKLDDDLDVDNDDFQLFFGCVTGPNGTGNPACAD